MYRKWKMNFHSSVMTSPQIGDGSEQGDKSSTRTCSQVWPFSVLRPESTAGSLTHFLTAASVFGQHILLILIVAESHACMQSPPCAGIQMLLSSRVCVSAKC